MTKLGYTLMTEQSPPTNLVRYAADAERAGFDFEVSSDHYFPWLDSMGHACNAWTMLGAVAHVTERVELMTYVTCPTLRYHPAVVAQQAATLGLLSEGRFTLGLGSGENLNEHVVGRGWPSVSVREEMFREAIDIIRALFGGGYVDYRGEHFRVTAAKLWDLADTPPPIGIAVSGPVSCRIAGEKGDAMIAVEPKASLSEAFDAAGGAGKPRIGQLPISYGTDKDAAIDRAHDLFRWFGGGWKVNADLPGTAGFDSRQPVRHEGRRRGVDPVRRRRRRGEGRGQGVRRRRLHPCRAGADRRRPAGPVLPVGAERTAAGAARALTAPLPHQARIRRSVESVRCPARPTPSRRVRPARSICTCRWGHVATTGSTN